MDPNKFTLLVNDLMEKSVKEKVALQRKLKGTEDAKLHASSIILTYKKIPRPCGDCGDMVVGRTVEYAVYCMGKPNQHWKKCCNICRAKTKMERGLKDIEK